MMRMFLKEVGEADRLWENDRQQPGDGQVICDNQKGGGYPGQRPDSRRERNGQRAGRPGYSRRTVPGEKCPLWSSTAAAFRKISWKANCSVTSRDLLPEPILTRRDYSRSPAGGAYSWMRLRELPPLLQVKLLRVVQEKTFRRIGDAEDIRVDVRIISATNKNLEDNVKSGSVPRRPVLPTECHPASSAPSQGAERGYPCPDEALHREIFARIWKGDKNDIRLCPGIADAVPFSGKYP